MQSKKIHILSFKYALDGIYAALKEEPKLMLHFLAGIVVLFTSFILNISREDWMIIIFLIGFVIAIELTNTSIESVVNHFTQEFHPGAKLAKDISAGAVLVAAITSVIIGIIIFAPYIFK